MMTSAARPLASRIGTRAACWTAAATLAVLAAHSGTPARAGTAAVADPTLRPALLVAAPQRAVLLGIARAGHRLVATGERGIIVLSDDDGRNWRQVPSPTSVTLTAVAFAGSRDGWATGHAGTVLHTIDAGEHWSRQLDGVTAAALTARDTGGVRGPAGAALRKLAHELVADGADAPFLSLAAFDARRVIVAGANGLLLETHDGGATWASLFSRTDNVTGRNYYGIAARDRDIYLAGEQGLVERSRDGGLTFHRVATSYGGTFFAVAVPRAGTVLLAGLRGNALCSTDGGRRFAHVASAVPVSYSSIAFKRDGTAIFTNQAGQILTSASAGRSIGLAPAPPLFPLAAAIETADGALVAVGAGGAVRITSASAATKGTP
jgi:photosystem II stability/assembly factor-like uncharacterized protein